MADLIEDGKYGGGASLEISSAGTRLLGTWNISEPKTTGTGDVREFGDKNYAPIIELLRRERNS